MRCLGGAGQGQTLRWEAATVALDLLPVPQTEDGVERLVEAVALDARLDPEALEDRCAEAAAEAEQQPTPRERVEGRRLGGDGERIVDGEQQGGGAHAQRAGPSCEGRECHQRRGDGAGHEVPFRQPHRVQPQPLRQVDQPEARLPPRGVVGSAQREPQGEPAHRLGHGRAAPCGPAVPSR